MRTNTARPARPAAGQPASTALANAQVERIRRGIVGDGEVLGGTPIRSPGGAALVPPTAELPTVTR